MVAEPRSESSGRGGACLYWWEAGRKSSGSGSEKDEGREGGCRAKRGFSGVEGEGGIGESCLERG